MPGAFFTSGNCWTARTIGRVDPDLDRGRDRSEILGDVANYVDLLKWQTWRGLSCLPRLIELVKPFRVVMENQLVTASTGHGKKHADVPVL